MTSRRKETATTPICRPAEVQAKVESVHNSAVAIAASSPQCEVMGSHLGKPAKPLGQWQEALQGEQSEHEALWRDPEWRRRGVGEGHRP